ncbi:MAG: imidazoleglycerol-phosphate dehydratase HisB [Candidatus Omnitrophota bacterium]
MSRNAEFTRKTRETEIVVKLNVDGDGKSAIDTGIGFMDHMLELFSFHGLFDIAVTARGDLKVDIHHTNEDLGICLGQVFKKALGDCVGIKRFGSSEIPMDQARAKVSVNVSNRYAYRIATPPGSDINHLRKEGYSFEDGSDFFESFAKNLNINLHIDVISGTDLHHILEAIFKAMGVALDQATQIDPRRKEVPSTKGIL